MCVCVCVCVCVSRFVCPREIISRFCHYRKNPWFIACYYKSTTRQKWKSYLIEMQGTY